MKLSDVFVGKDNNFNLIRILAAFAVLITHSFALAAGTPTAEPWRESIGMTMGAIAVDIFFLTSGFLVSGSLLRGGGLLVYLRSRILRIYPGLFVMLFVSVFLVFPLVGSQKIVTYFLSLCVWVYLFKTGTLLLGVGTSLPGVFTNNPIGDLVNGSLWSMPHEVRLYVLLAGVWWLCMKCSKEHAKSLGRMALGIAVLSGAYLIFSRLALEEDRTTSRLICMYFAGVTFQTYKHKIKINKEYVALLVALLVAAIVLKNHKLFYVSYVIAVPWILFFAAFVKNSVLAKYNILGDYSYGVYIYAWPIQQVLLFSFAGMSTLALLGCSVGMALGCAVLSWHFVEKPALSLKNR